MGHLEKWCRDRSQNYNYETLSQPKRGGVFILQKNFGVVLWVAGWKCFPPVFLAFARATRAFSASYVAYLPSTHNAAFLILPAIIECLVPSYSLLMVLIF